MKKFWIVIGIISVSLSVLCSALAAIDYNVSGFLGWGIAALTQLILVSRDIDKLNSPTDR